MIVVGEAVQRSVVVTRHAVDPAELGVLRIAALGCKPRLLDPVGRARVLGVAGGEHLGQSLRVPRRHHRDTE